MASAIRELMKAIRVMNSLRERRVWGEKFKGIRGSSWEGAGSFQAAAYGKKFNMFP